MFWLICFILLFTWPVFALIGFALAEPFLIPLRKFEKWASSVVLW